MSVKVPLDELGDEVRRYASGYLLTSTGEGRPHVLALTPEVTSGQEDEGADGVRLRFDAGGRRACRNVEAQPEVTVLFPPRPGGDGFSLLVDGTAIVDGDVVEVRPTGAVLHRPAPPLDTDSSGSAR